MAWSGMAGDEDPRLRDRFGKVVPGTKYTDAQGTEVTVLEGGGAAPAKVGWQPSGGGEARDDQGNLIGGTSAYDQTVDKFRDKGLASHGRAAVALDQGQADEARGLQMGGLGLMGAAARGHAPSRAEALGTAATDTTARGALAGLAGGRGAGAAIAGANAAGAAAAGRMAQQNASATELRGQEMARNQQEFAAGAGAMRGQDDDAAIKNAKFEAAQRLANERRQQSFEDLGYDTRKFQQDTAGDYLDLREGQETREKDAELRREAAADARGRRMVGATLEAGLGGAGGDTGSDEEMKHNVRQVTMGSLAGLSRFMHGR